MPRTKASTRPKHGAAATSVKRTRDSVTEEAMASALRELEKTVDSQLMKIALDFDQRSDDLDRIFNDIDMQLGPQVLAMTIAEMGAHAAQIIAEASTFSSHCSTSYADHHLSNLTGGKSSEKRTPRDDEGYLTEASSSRSSNTSNMTNTQHNSTAAAPQLQSLSTTATRTGRPLGPLASAKAKGRRGRSAQGTRDKDTTSSSQAQKPHNSSTLLRSNSQRQPRSVYRTPAQSRLQTMSAERGTMMAPVTPKMQPDRPISMLRYQKMGETVISLSGSPVIAQGVTREGANINIPVPNGIISVLPSAMLSVEPNFMAQLDIETLQQLRMLQSNLNLMMSQVKQ